MFRQAGWAAMFLFSACATAVPANAQGLETLGSRAAAMAAFVAVADDASAVAWNPSGLVAGPFFNLQLDLGRSTDHPDGRPTPGDGAGRGNATLVALGTTPVGLAYYRLSNTSLIVSPADQVPPDRQNGQVLARTLVTSHIGATVQQSVGELLTLGATLKLVRGSVGVASVDTGTWEEAFDAVEAVARSGSTRGDLDVGATLAAGRMRAAVVVRNLTAPSFGDESGQGDRARLERHVRIGVAWADRWPGISATVLSVDADVTEVPHAGGVRRDVAAGVERWVRGRHIGVRGGVRVSTLGDVRPVVSAGGSYAVRAGIYVDAFVARGAHDDRAWGLAARVTY
jgi:hypothetical protein